MEDRCYLCTHPLGGHRTTRYALAACAHTVLYITVHARCHRLLSSKTERKVLAFCDNCDQAFVDGVAWGLITSQAQVPPPPTCPDGLCTLNGSRIQGSL